MLSDALLSIRQDVPCPGCHGPLGRIWGEMESEHQRRLLDSAMARWAVVAAGVDPLALVTMEPMSADEPLGLCEQLVWFGHLDAEQALAAFEPPARAACQRCGLEVLAGEALIPHLGDLPCSRCSGPIAPVAEGSNQEDSLAPSGDAGLDFWQVLLARGRVGPELVSEALGRTHIIVECPSCTRSYALSPLIRPYLSELVCPSCQKLLATPPAPDPATPAQSTLLERAFAAWAVHAQGLDAVVVEAARGQAEALHEHLVWEGRLALGQVLAACEEPRGIVCTGCEQEFELGEQLCAQLPHLRCPACDAPLRLAD